MTSDQINYLNIGLILLSCIAAYIFPFELFLISYAVLGPLHYLTEISWLHDRRYFAETKRKKRPRFHRNWLILVAVTMCALMLGFVANEILHRPISPKWEITLFYLVLVSALLITEVKNKMAKVAIFTLALVALALFSGSRYYIILALFLVTIIHVFIFTGAFILYGAMKSRSASGILSLVIFLLCAASFFVFSPELSGSPVGDYVRGSYRSFDGLNAELLKLFNLSQGNLAQEIYVSKPGLMLMRLIAFAYTYHYLNWFSKTSIIKWHEVPKTRIAIIVVIWIIALALYGHDYDTGMAILYFLSILHVMLEFPLNHRTFAGIGRELYAMGRR